VQLVAGMRFGESMHAGRRSLLARASRLGGYMSSVLFIDLSHCSIERRQLESSELRKFIGGYGIGARVLYEWIPEHADPLGGENVLGFVARSQAHQRR
jgi:hypothetical protein